MFGAVSFGQVKFGSVLGVVEAVEPPTWPVATLTGKPSYIGYGFTDVADPNASEVKGEEQFLPRSGRSPIMRKYTIKYPIITQADKAILETFQEDTVNYGALKFLWTDPVLGDVYDMRLSNLITFTAIKGSVVRYSCEVTIYGELNV